MPYKVMLPETVLQSNDVERHAKNYLRRYYPDREYIRIDGSFVLSRMKNIG